ncbi:MAG: tryptophan 2,3-dioxygenase family protein [Gammaproteobacteria bacterium]
MKPHSRFVDLTCNVIAFTVRRYSPPSKERLTHVEYLDFPSLLGAQKTLSTPLRHDELLFFCPAHVTELWFKLILFELIAARDRIRIDYLGPREKISPG